MNELEMKYHEMEWTSEHEVGINFRNIYQE